MRILVIEDDRKLAELMRRGLTEQGYAVDVAFSGEEGEQLVQTVHYDLISLDIMLPDKDGISVCQTIRQKKADTPILMITAKDTIQDKIKGLDSGADDYLTKPFNFEELFARVRALLRREEKPISNRIEAGDLVMDTAARKVWLAGTEIETKGKEYSVLECLMRHPDSVVSRTMIEQYIRDIRLDTKYNLVDVYVCRLRSKIDKKGQNSLIETVRSFGYRLRTKMRFFHSIKFKMNIYTIMLVAIAVLFFSLVTYLLLAQRASMMNLDAVKLSTLKIQVTPLTGAGAPNNTSNSNSSYKLISSYVLKGDMLQKIRSGASSPFEMHAPEGIYSFEQRDIVSPDMTGDQEVWVYSRPAANQPGYYDLLVVTQSKAPSLAVLGAYRKSIYVAIPITLILTGLLSYFLIRQLLKPLGMITQAAGEIREKNFERRIEIKNKDELGELSAALNQTFERLQESFEREHQFSGDTSHELRAPLAIMQGEATLALNKPRSREEYRRHLESISEQISHMSAVVSKLLFLARSDKGQESLNLEEVNLKDILENVAELTQAQRAEKNLGFTLETAEEIKVRGDETRLEELFLNLMDNAIKYTPAGGKISLSLTNQGQTAEVSVQDNGPGIPPEHLSHLFERFYRVNPGGAEGGHGLGLAICQRIIELHHGRIKVESKLGEGSKFSVTLPLAR